MATLAKNVTLIPAKPQQKGKGQNKKLKAAAYCRVSTDTEEQLNSYKNQLDYYNDKICSNPDWEPVRVFADEGITGVTTLKREEFNDMIDMCKDGKIDVILTKSIHRFARNTLDTVKYVRMLRAINVNVIFEQEGLQGINPDDEPFIAIYASMAQNYSQTLSENVKWGYRRSFAKGGVYIGSGMLGYRRGDDGELEIVPREAEVIRLIYKLYLDGYSEGSIAREMEKHGFRTAKGNTKWYHKTVDSILSNEKYMGDAVSQKTYIQDIFSKKSVKNTGQLPQYYITDSHEGIISKEVFKRVQFERARRRSMAPVTGKTKTNAGRFAPKYALTGLLLCGECGHHYRRTTWYRKSGTKVVWRCTNRLDNGSRFCRESHTISEPALHKALAKFIAGLASSKGELTQTLEGYAVEVIEQETGSAKKKELQEKLEMTEKRMQLILSADIISEELIERISEEYDQLKQEIEKLSDQRETMERHNAYLNGIREYLQDADFDTMQYDDRLVSQVIEQIIVKSKDRLYVRVKGGYETEITIGEE